MILPHTFGRTVAGIAPAGLNCFHLIIFFKNTRKHFAEPHH
jgi:hypothetical protein